LDITTNSKAKKFVSSSCVILTAKGREHETALRIKGPKVYYVYADASGNGCLYAGIQQNYQNFQTLLTQSQLVAEQYQAAQMNAWEWNSWGPGWSVGETGTPE
jgi:hypothetical protein